MGLLERMRPLSGRGSGLLQRASAFLEGRVSVLEAVESKPEPLPQNLPPKKKALIR